MSLRSHNLSKAESEISLYTFLYSFCRQLKPESLVYCHFISWILKNILFGGSHSVLYTCKNILVYKFMQGC